MQLAASTNGLSQCFDSIIIHSVFRFFKIEQEGIKNCSCDKYSNMIKIKSCKCVRFWMLNILASYSSIWLLWLAAVIWIYRQHQKMYPNKSMKSRNSFWNRNGNAALWNPSRFCVWQAHLPVVTLLTASSNHSLVLQLPNLWQVLIEW